MNIEGLYKLQWLLIMSIYFWDVFILIGSASHYSFT